MKTISILFFSMLALVSFGAGTNISRYPNTTSLQGSDTFIIERPGDTNYNVTAAQMPGELGVQPTNSNLTDWGQWGTNAYANVVSNRTVSGLGSAAFTASSAYDAAGAGATAATAATNALGVGSQLSAFAPTNQFDGAGTAAGVSAVLSNHLNAANITQGTIPFAVLGLSAPALGHTNIFMFKTDGSFIGYDLASLLALSGGGTGLVPANNLSDVANTGTSLQNLGGISNNYTGTFNVSGLHITVGMTNDSWTASTLLEADSHKKITSIANGAGALTNDASGNFGYAPLLDASQLQASQYAATDANTNLVSTLNGFSWTNLDTHFTNYGTVTNIVLPADGNNWRVLATNGPHLFFNFGGNNMGAVSVWVTTNGDSQWPAQVQMLGYSNHLTTNCIIDFQPWGGTNKVLGGQSEL